MIRRAMLLVLTALVLVSLSGCMGGGPGIDTSAIKAAIGAVIDDFEEDIEAYHIDDVDGALACLSGADFELTLKEAGQTYTKEYATLVAELEADKEYQLEWRGEEIGYHLDLQEPGVRTFSVNEAGGHVYHTFQVVEWANGIPARVTDQGVMTWEFVKVGGQWKAKRLLIEFQAVTDKAAGVGAKEGLSRGFGFGVGYPGLSK